MVARVVLLEIRVHGEEGVIEPAEYEKKTMAIRCFNRVQCIPVLGAK
jgi:hypothetical protein